MTGADRDIAAVDALPSSRYLKRTTCPCCDAPRDRAVPAFASDPRAEDLPPEQHSGFVSGYAAQRVFFTYFRCGDCDACFCPVFYTLAQLAQHYGNQSENMAEVPLGARQRTQQGYADLLMRHSRGAGGYVEIGADIGLFAKRCAEDGRFDHYWLYEPNQAVHHELAARFDGLPHTVHGEMWPTNDIPQGSCSTAALIHVLDHLLDPAAFLAALGEKLEDGGVVLVVTHNTASLLARMLGRRWPPFALQHPQLYSPPSITRLFERAGYDILQIAGAINYFPLMHLARGALSVCGLPAVMPRVQGPTVSLRLGNMAVVARKRRRR